MRVNHMTRSFCPMSRVLIKTNSMQMMHKSSNVTQVYKYDKKNEGVADNVVWSEGLISTKDRIEMTGRIGATMWITGLSGSGKSTVACALEHYLLTNYANSLPYRLDGDNVRFGLNKDLGFSFDDREENIRRIGEVAKLLNDCGGLAITAFISPYRSSRDLARKEHKKAGLEFYEVYTDVSLEVAEQRDPKGLYKKARAGEIKNFTGIDDPYEAPIRPDLILRTDKYDVNECVAQCVEFLERKQVLKK